MTNLFSWNRVLELLDSWEIVEPQQNFSNMHTKKIQGVTTKNYTIGIQQLRETPCTFAIARAKIMSTQTNSKSGHFSFLYLVKKRKGSWSNVCFWVGIESFGKKEMITFWHVILSLRIWFYEIYVGNYWAIFKSTFKFQTTVSL